MSKVPGSSRPPSRPRTGAAGAEYVSEEEAARLWQRAAQLQAEAAHRSELRAAGEGEATEDEPGDGVQERGYAVEHVRVAAIEAGISEEYLDAAFADLRAERALPVVRGRALARAFLGDPPDEVTVRRVVHASVEDVLQAMEEIFPSEPYRLTLKDRQGDPRDGGILVFEIQGATLMPTDIRGFTNEASWADLRQVYVTLARIAGRSPACELTVRAPVAWAQNLNAGISALLSGLGGLLGGGVGGGVGAALASAGIALFGASIVPVSVFGGTIAGFGLSVKGMRMLHNHAMAVGERALDRLLADVAMRAQGGWGLSTSSEQP